MTAKHLEGLSTSTVLREAAIVLRQQGTPTAEVYAEQLVFRAELLEQAAAKEIAGRPESPWPGPADLLHAIAELRR